MLSKQRDIEKTKVMIVLVMSALVIIVSTLSAQKALIIMIAIA